MEFGHGGFIEDATDDRLTLICSSTRQNVVRISVFSACMSVKVCASSRWAQPCSAAAAAPPNPSPSTARAAARAGEVAERRRARRWNCASSMHTDVTNNCMDIQHNGCGFAWLSRPNSGRTRFFPWGKWAVRARHAEATSGCGGCQQADKGPIDDSR